MSHIYDLTNKCKQYFASKSEKKKRKNLHPGHHVLKVQNEQLNPELIKCRCVKQSVCPLYNLVGKYNTPGASSRYSQNTKE